MEFIKRSELFDENNLRAVRMENGLRFGVENRYTGKFEYFEYQNGKLLELEEVGTRGYEGDEYYDYTTYNLTGLELRLQYINEITK